MNQHRSVACPHGCGGEHDERLFTEQTTCSRCRQWYNDDELKESKTMGGQYCPTCWKEEEAEHYASDDYEGDHFE